MNYHVSVHAINFVEGETFDDFIAKRRSAETRRKLRKRQLALQALGKVEFGFIKEPEAARRMVRLCLEWKSAQLARLGHWDSFQRPDIRDFIIDYFSTAAGKDTWVASLTLDGIPLAAAFGFASRKEWLLYQMSMDIDRSAQTPGTQLLLNLMSNCIEAGVGRLDLARGDEPYKFEWCDEHSELWISTLPLTVKGHVVQAMIRAKATARKRLASNERLYDMAKSLKRRVVNARTGVIQRWRFRR
jgi:CelD/BcsL family acetyltransferase involved in cellulose biosynthesis